jgi:hypothetical protein
MAVGEVAERHPPNVIAEQLPQAFPIRLSECLEVYGPRIDMGLTEPEAATVSFFTGNDGTDTLTTVHILDLIMCG